MNFFEKLLQKLPKKENSSEKIEKMLSDLRRVGPDKPLGYLAIDTLINICKVDPDKLEQELKEKGLKTLRLEYPETNVVGGALFAYDEDVLKQLLENNRVVLEEAGWPIDAEAFVRHLKIFASNVDIYNIIAEAYGNKTRPGDNLINYATIKAFQYCLDQESKKNDIEIQDAEKIEEIRKSLRQK